MKIFTESEARALLEKVIKLSVADECNASLGGSIDGNIRFALNNVSTSGIVSDASLAVRVAFGKRTGVATINEFDDAALERVVRRAEDLARLAPDAGLHERRFMSRQPEQQTRVEVRGVSPSPPDEAGQCLPSHHQFRARSHRVNIMGCASQY